LSRDTYIGYAYVLDRKCMVPAYSVVHVLIFGKVVTSHETRSVV